MEKKRMKMQSHCKALHRLIQFLWILITILIICITIYTVITATKPASLFHAKKINNEWFINIEETTLTIANVIPQEIISAGVTELPNAKTAHMLILITTLLAMLLPILFILYWAKETFRDIAYGTTPFSDRSTKRLKRMAFTIIAISIITKPLMAILVSAFITKEFYLQLSLNFSGVIMGMVVLSMAHVFDYVCELQREYNETL